MNNDNQASSASFKRYEVKFYKRRWSFLVALFLLQIFSGLSYSSFGQISNFYVKFYSITFTQVVWTTLCNSVAPIVAIAPFAWLIYKGFLGPKQMSVFVAVTFAVGYSLFALSTLSRNCFSVLLIGQVLNGLAGFVLFAIPPIFATLWFPENQVGTALSANYFGYNVGLTMGLIIPTQAMNLFFSDANKLGEILEHDNFQLRIMYSSYATVCIFVSIFLIVFLTDRPPTPPTYAQELKVEQNEKKTSQDTFGRQTSGILTDKTFIFNVVVFGISFQASAVEFAMMPQILKPYVTDPDVKGANVLTAFCVGGVVCSFIAGYIVNHYKRYDVLSVIANGISFLASVGIVLSVKYFNYDALLATNVLFGFFSVVFWVVAYEIATQQTYPIDETFVSVWFVGFALPFAVYFGEVGQLILNSFGGIATLIFMSANVLLSFVLSCLFDSKNKRLKIEDAQDCLHTTEETNLLEQSIP